MVVVVCVWWWWRWRWCVFVCARARSLGRLLVVQQRGRRVLVRYSTCGHVVDNMSWLAWQSRRERKRERGGERELEGKESGGGGVGARIGQHGPEVGGDGESGDEQEGKAKHARPCRQAEPRRQQVRAHNLCTVGRWRDNGFVCAREQGTAARAQWWRRQCMAAAVGARWVCSSVRSPSLRRRAGCKSRRRSRFRTGRCARTRAPSRSWVATEEPGGQCTTALG